MPEVFALVDCNNFFVSCERAFQPALEKVPVAVLSNNDGCFISRSKEVKDLGIPMGAPYFKYKDIVQKNNIKVFSSNFSLYGDLSQRVMTTLEEFTDELEVYSIDEAFLKLPGGTSNEALGQTIRQTVRQWTRIPVSIGIASTKVLAKVANHMAKKYPHFNGVCDITHEDVSFILHDLPVGELWGIGRKSTKKLKALGVTTAGQLLEHSDAWIRKHLSITGLHIAYELRGIPCFKLDDDPEPKKGIMCTRSFGKAVTTKDALKEAVATYTERAAEKLREEGLVTSYFYIYIRTNRFNLDKKYTGSKGFHLPVASSYTPYLVSKAMELVDAVYRDGYRYFKAGVCCVGLLPETTVQQNLFTPVAFEKNNSLMQAVDRVNRHFGKDTLFIAGSGIKKEWSMRKDHTSQRFTTSLKELPTVR